MIWKSKQYGSISSLRIIQCIIVMDPSVFVNAAGWDDLNYRLSRHGYVKPFIRTQKKALRISAGHLKSWFPKFCHVGSNNYISAAPEECVLVAQGK